MFLIAKTIQRYMLKNRTLHEVMFRNRQAGIALQKIVIKPIKHLSLHVFSCFSHSKRKRLNFEATESLPALPRFPKEMEASEPVADSGNIHEIPPSDVDSQSVSSIHLTKDDDDGMYTM